MITYDMMLKVFALLMLMFVTFAIADVSEKIEGMGEE